MNGNGDASQKLSQHLHAAIKRVREDVAEVEFWADAVAGFTQPVPDYDPSGTKVWLPSEQASSLSPRDTHTPADKSRDAE